MLKYIQYLISPLELIMGIYVCTLGAYYPAAFFLIFTITVILGDFILPDDTKQYQFSYPKFLDLFLYINLPLLLILVFTVIFIFSSDNSTALIHLFSTYLNIDLVQIKNSLTLIDRVALIGMTGLFIGTMGTNVGHELTHRKKNKVDMFIGNWLLALSWDCAFAIEHVYGHHKNVCLQGDPSSAKRGENIYAFIMRAIFKGQRDAWKIEFSHLERRGYYKFGLHNKMVIGYTRSLIITILAYLVGGVTGMLFFLLCAFLGKCLLETVNYMEHYGLVRQKGEPVYPRHSWNSNSFMSGIILYNLTRHSAHHEKANLKFWELKSYPDAPIMPYGYLTMIFIIIFAPYMYHRIMTKKLADWDNNYASGKERELAIAENQNNRLSIFRNLNYT